jgi:hypothetical protein
MVKPISAMEYVLFAEAWLCLAAARFVVVTVPFKRIASFMGIHEGDSSVHSQEETRNNEFKNISVAILRASHRSPWRTKCLEQALAAKLMLKGRGLRSTIYFGVASSQHESKTLAAHAWLVCNGEIVTGGKGIDAFTVVGKFNG